MAGPALHRAQRGTTWGADTGGLGSWDSVSRLLPCFRLNALAAFLLHLPSRPRLPSHPTFIKAEIPVRNTLFLKHVACVCFLDQTQTGSHKSSRRGCGIRTRRCHSHQAVQRLFLSASHRSQWLLAFCLHHHEARWRDFPPFRRDICSREPQLLVLCQLAFLPAAGAPRRPPVSTGCRGNGNILS